MKNSGLERLSRKLSGLYAQNERFIRWRVWAFFASLLIILGGLAINNWLGFILLIGCISGFGYLVIRHNQVIQTINQFETWLKIKRTHIARANLNWDEIPLNVGEAKAEHPFALDIDLIGDYSIFRLLDTTITRGGNDRLLSWLLASSPDIETINKRQALITELIPLSMFRDRMILNAVHGNKRGLSFQHKWDGERLLGWLRASNTLKVSKPTLLFLSGLSLINIGLFLLFNLADIPPIWIGSFILFIVASGWQWRKMGQLFSEALALQAEVRRLRSTFRHLETKSYARQPHLSALCTPFQDRHNRPTAHLHRLNWITAAASLQRNPIVWLMINFVMPWDILFAYLLERSRGNLGRLLPVWLNTWYELEALSALANFAHLNPEYTFPEVQSGRVFDGVAIGHPLIPAKEKVCNDFELDQHGQVIIITGSNMSGKSSFLRTLGVNLVLAYCGSVVNARSLTIGTFQLFTCIRVTDSVVDGISYFYAEVKRLKSLLNAHESATEAQPLFFLIDEIFRGTNNRERLIGSRSFIKSIATGHSTGLIATHDLELVNLADDLSQIHNYHFRETIQDSKMVFDYILRHGPSPTTNALKIMELEGLPMEILPDDETTTHHPI